MMVVDISDTVRGTTTELRLNGSIFSPTASFYATLSPKMLYEEFEVDSINCWAIAFVDDGLFIMPQSKKLNFISGTTSQKVIITIPSKFIVNISFFYILYSLLSFGADSQSF